MSLTFNKPSNNRVVVRLSTTCWSDKRGIHKKQSLTFLRRKCKGFNFFEEDNDMVGAEQVMAQVIGLDLQDGIYEVRPCNVYTDWETGHVDSYDYELVPFKE